MKICITKILEGGIELNTMRELPRSVQVEHGVHKATMPITDEQLSILMSLIAQGSVPAPTEEHYEETDDEVFDIHEVSEEDYGPEEDSTYADSETGVAAF